MMQGYFSEYYPIEPEVLRCEQTLEPGMTIYKVAYPRQGTNNFYQVKWSKYSSGAVLPECAVNRSQYDSWSFNC